MKYNPLLVVLLLTYGFVMAQNKEDQEGAVLEWERFKSFEYTITKEDATETMASSKLKAYVRDSIQVLGVKLGAIKRLDEKNLLQQDILDYPQYYLSLLIKLRESGIPKNEYLFLEEKLALINQGKLTKQLTWNRTFNVLLGLFCLVLIFVLIRKTRRSPDVAAPELSKQELTVKNLILEGKTNKEIASELFISLSTVKSHITNLYAKLNVANRQELFQKSTGAST